MVNNPYKVWVEVDKSAVEYNAHAFRRLISKNTKLWGVVKSNAYGHNLIDFSKLLDKFGVDGFCVDSVVEGLKLRKNGIKKSILVLGPTSPRLFKDALNNDITLTISTFEALKFLAELKKPAAFHLKVDTGMHRQGFYLKDLPRVIKFIKSKNLNLQGVYTHFASAKDFNYPTYTNLQLDNFLEAVSILKKAGFENLVRHAAATGGALVNKKYHLDAARIGIGLYGLWPSKELELQANDNLRDFKLKPVLSWHTVVSEVKEFNKGDFIGYDLTERMGKQGRLAVLPIGYWHGLSRGLSGSGEVLINGRKARILGRISMDLAIADVSDINCKWGDKVTLVGRQGKEEILAEEVARKCGTINYDIITGINPLIKRVLV